MDLDEARQYFRDRALEIRAECCHESPWVFLNAAAFIEYLAKAVTGGNYGCFVREWLGRVRSGYIGFRYLEDDKDDLPEQMWHILRNGLVHSFSFVPEKPERGGRSQSIELLHRSAGVGHLSPYRDGGRDAAVLVAEDLADDLIKLVELLFDEAQQDATLRERILRRLKDHPPLSSKP